MYSLLKAWRDTDTEKQTRDRINEAFVSKLTGVFRTDDLLLRRLVRRRQGGSHCVCQLVLEDHTVIAAGFTSLSKSHMDPLSYPPKAGGVDPLNTTVYIPPKEIISATENFRFLYEDMHIAFEETYYDLARLLDRPLKKGTNTAEQKQVLEKLGELMHGSIVQRENRFYLRIPGKAKRSYERGVQQGVQRALNKGCYFLPSVWSKGRLAFRQGHVFFG